ncbi:peptidase, M48B family [Escherichia coli]|nr:peptidase, M48B family [Escherichia coli]
MLNTPVIKSPKQMIFSFDLLKKRGISTQGLVGSFEKTG